MKEIGLLLKAVRFAAHRHRFQRRKDEDASPYINHPIEAAEILANVGNVSDLPTLLAAVLHDTVEDTDTTFSELEEVFGRDVRQLVEEVTDDKSLPKDVRKRLQIEHAQGLSSCAKQIKIADKICNVRDVTHTPPPNCSLERRRDGLGGWIRGSGQAKWALGAGSGHAKWLIWQGVLLNLPSKMRL